MRHMAFFWRPKSGVGVGGKKFMLKRFMNMLFVPYFSHSNPVLTLYLLHCIVSSPVWDGHSSKVQQGLTPPPQDGHLWKELQIGCFYNGGTRISIEQQMWVRPNATRFPTSSLRRECLLENASRPSIVFQNIFEMVFFFCVSTQGWWYQGLAPILKLPLNPQNCRNKHKVLEKGTLIFCTKPWYVPNPGMHLVCTEPWFRKEIWIYVKFEMLWSSCKATCRNRTSIQWAILKAPA